MSVVLKRMMFFKLSSESDILKSCVLCFITNIQMSREGTSVSLEEAGGVRFFWPCSDVAHCQETNKRGRVWRNAVIIKPAISARYLWKLYALTKEQGHAHGRVVSEIDFWQADTARPQPTDKQNLHSHLTAVRC